MHCRRVYEVGCMTILYMTTILDCFCNSSLLVIEGNQKETRESFKVVAKFVTVLCDVCVLQNFIHSKARIILNN